MTRRSKSMSAALGLSAVLLTACGQPAGSPPEADAATDLPPVDAATDVCDDRDGDDLCAALEDALGLDPGDPDSDHDRVPDGDEDADGDGLSNRDEVARGTSPGDPDSDGDGIPDGLEVELLTDPRSGAGACGDAAGTPAPVPRPVDIILVVDSSGSMSEESTAIEEALISNLAAPLDAAAIDYRIVLLARFPCPTTDGTTFCLDQPPGAAAPVQDCAALRAGSCDSDVAPVNTERFFHCNAFVGSNRLFDLAAYSFSDQDDHGSRYGGDDDLNGAIRCEQQLPAGWGSLLRDSSKRVFVLVSDDDATSAVVDPPLWDTADEFHAELIARDPAFGTASQARYGAHLIGGLAGYPGRPTGVWYPTDPPATAECAEADSPSTQYQLAAIRAGGLRFPICNVAAIPALLGRIADDIAQTSTIACAYAPIIASDEDPDLERIGVVFWPDAGGDDPEIFARVADAGACGVGHAYYVAVDDEGRPLIQLCPGTCGYVTDEIQANPDANLRMQIACGIPIVD